jgi:hypothetical protein
VFLRGESRVITAVMAITAGVLVAVLILEGREAILNSPQNAILAEAERLLADYHRDSGHYPDTLEELPFQFHGDGRPETLKLFTYQSDGEHYALVTHSVATGAEMKSCK